MAVVQKPTLKDPQGFISQAKTDKAKNVKPLGEESEQKHSDTQVNNSDSQKKSKKMTVYMTEDMYLKWKEYEFSQLKVGKKVSFQGTIEGYLKRLLK